LGAIRSQYRAPGKQLRTAFSCCRALLTHSQQPRTSAHLIAAAVTGCGAQSSNDPSKPLAACKTFPPRHLQTLPNYSKPSQPVTKLHKTTLTSLKPPLNGAKQPQSSEQVHSHVSVSALGSLHMKVRGRRPCGTCPVQGCRGQGPSSSSRKAHSSGHAGKARSPSPVPAQGVLEQHITSPKAGQSLRYLHVCARQRSPSAEN